MKNRLLTLLLITLAVLSANAKARTWQQLMLAAQKELAPTEVGQTMRKAKKQLRMLDDRQAVAVVGYEDGGFVVMATDDMYPEVLGCSETRYNPDTRNENFRWWLDAITKVVSMPRTQPLKAIAPDTDKYPASVAPLVKTKWDQDSPYNNFCPSGCPTGCVATAAAQVIKFLKWPAQGQGNVFTYVPFGDFDGRKYEEDIDGQEYDYAKMLNRYNGTPTREQKTAVAKLMYHVGLAMKAQYNSSGTGSYNESLVHGLRQNLGYPYAVTVNKSDYTAEEWMDMLFRCISDSLPLVYGGADESYTGHEFVLHGYNKQGKIYVNWGWSGSEDGYFDLSSLLIYYGIYDFNSYQDVILRMDPRRVNTEMVEVTLDAPGTLADKLGDERRDTVVWLKVSGSINSTDIKTLRAMAGADSQGHGTWGNLSVLDLSDATIVAGGEPYLVEGDDQWTTADGVMPYKAFYKCSMLIDVTLPSSLKSYADGVFAGCNNLERVKATVGSDADFVVVDNQVLSTDLTQLIEQWPSEEIDLRIPDGVSVVHPYAFAARFHYERLTIPASVTEVGAYAFNRCFDLVSTYVYATEPPTTDPTAIDDLDISLRHLYVPKGTRSAYRSAPGWKKYSSRITEFDATALGIETAAAQRPAPADIYAADGRLVRKAWQGTQGLKPGVYVVAGKKWVVR